MYLRVMRLRNTAACRCHEHFCSYFKWGTTSLLLKRACKTRDSLQVSKTFRPESDTLPANPSAHSDIDLTLSHFMSVPLNRILLNS